jgi:site-specific recombinase XerD
VRRRRLPPYELLRQWTQYAQASDLAPTTIASYQYYLVRFSAERMVDLQDASHADVHAFLADRGNRGPSKGQARRALRHFYRFAEASRLPLKDGNPTAALPRVREPRKVPAFLEEEQLCRLVYTAAMWRPEWAWQIVFLAATGMRIGEACALKTASDVDLDRGRLIVRESKTKRGRVVHMGPWSRAATLALSNCQPRLFPMTASAIRRRFAILGAMAGFPPGMIHPHTLRHTCGTLLSERGATREEIMAQLGHVDPKMVDWYIHITSKRAKRVADLL